MELERYHFEMAVASCGLNQYDVIHTQDVVSTRAISRVKPGKVRLIATLHGCLTKEFLHAGLLKDTSMSVRYSEILEYVGAASSDHTCVPSQWLKRILCKDLNVPDQQITVIPNGMDVHSFCKRMNQHPNISAPQNKKVIVCVGRLTSLKGHDFLLQALSTLKEKRDDWVCWLVGEGELHNKLRQKVRALNLVKYVQFLGKRDDVPALLQKSDLFVLPSLQENLPYVVMEAQISGTPVVVTNAGGMPEMVEHGKTGLIAKKGHAASLYTQIYTLLKDADLGKQLAYAAESKGMQKWSAEHMMKQMEAMYKSRKGREKSPISKSQGVPDKEIVHRYKNQCRD